MYIGRVWGRGEQPYSFLLLPTQTWNQSLQGERVCPMSGFRQSLSMHDTILETTYLKSLDS